MSLCELAGEYPTRKWDSTIAPETDWESFAWGSFCLYVGPGKPCFAFPTKLSYSASERRTTEGCCLRVITNAS